MKNILCDCDCDCEGGQKAEHIGNALAAEDVMVHLNNKSSIGDEVRNVVKNVLCDFWWTTSRKTEIFESHWIGSLCLILVLIGIAVWYKLHITLVVLGRDFSDSRDNVYVCYTLYTCICICSYHYHCVSWALSLQYRLADTWLVWQVWDIGGQPRFRSMWERYCRGVNAIV